MSLKLGFVCCLFAFVAGHEPLPKDLPEQMYCAGCTSTFKALAKLMIQHESADSMESRVEAALRKVCKDDNFKDSDLGAKYLLMACEHLVKNHRREMQEKLVEYYSKKDRRGKTYLDIAHTICNEETFACAGGPKDGEKQKGEPVPVFLDEETGEFKFNMGDKVRMVEPVREIKDEL